MGYMMVVMVIVIMKWMHNDVYPLVNKHGWLEHPLEMGVSLGKSSINGGFSMIFQHAMFDYQRERKKAH